MGSLMIDIIRQGMLASLTGGWYYDPHHGTFINTVHLYVFLFFLCFPLTVALYFPDNVWSWLFYVVATGILFTILKIVNCVLHRMYDTTEGQYECNEETNIFGPEKRKLSQKSESRPDEEEGIEMHVLSSSDSRRAIINGELSPSNSDISIYLPMMTDPEVPVTVDVHRRNSSGSSQGSVKVSTSVNETNRSSSVMQPYEGELCAWCQEIDHDHHYITVGVDANLDDKSISPENNECQREVSVSDKSTLTIDNSGITVYIPVSLTREVTAADNAIVTSRTIIETNVTRSIPTNVISSIASVGTDTADDNVVADTRVTSSILNTILNSTFPVPEANSPLVIISRIPLHTLIPDTPITNRSSTDFPAIMLSDNLITSTSSSSFTYSDICNTSTLTTVAPSVVAIPLTVSSNAVITAGSSGRLSEKSRRFSVSATLGGTQQSVISDTGPSLSLQLGEDKIQEEEKGLLFWKQKWENTTEHSKSDSIISPSEAPSMYKSDTVYSIEERSSECNKSSGSGEKPESISSEDDDEQEQNRGYNGTDIRLDNEDAEYGDVEDDDDNSRSPLLVSKRRLKKTSSSEVVKNCNHPLANSGSTDKRRDFFEGNPSISTTRRMRYLTEIIQERVRDNRENNFLQSVSSKHRMSQSSPNLRIQPSTLSIGKDVPLEILEDANRPHVVDNGFRDCTTQTSVSAERFETNINVGTCEFVNEINDISTVAINNEDDNVTNDIDDRVSDEKDDNNKINEINEPSSSGSNNELSSLLPASTTTSLQTAATATVTTSTVTDTMKKSPTFVIVPTTGNDDGPSLSSSPVSLATSTSSPPLLRLSRRMAVRFNPPDRLRPRRTRRQRPSLISGGSSHQTVFRYEGDGSTVLDVSRQFNIPITNYGRHHHVATSHDDTADGAVHLFRDENGQWMSYTFDSAGDSNVAVTVDAIIKQMSSTIDGTDDDKLSSTTTTVVTTTTATCSFSHSNAGFDNCTMFVNSGLRSCFGDDYYPMMCESPVRTSIRSHLYQIREHEISFNNDNNSINTTTTNNNNNNDDDNNTAAITTINNSNNNNNNLLSPSMIVGLQQSGLFLSRTVPATTISDCIGSRIPTTTTSATTQTGTNTSREIQVDLDVIGRNTIDNNNNNNNNNGNNSNNNQHHHRRHRHRHRHHHRQNRYGFLECSDMRAEQQQQQNHEQRNSSSNKCYYYKLRVLSDFRVKIYFNRLQLLTLFDYDRHEYELLLSLALSSLVSCLGGLIISFGFYRDIGLFVFCFVTAGSQYSLLKSVQPDVSSPTHGYNRIVAYSRPVYYVVCTSAILILHYVLRTHLEEEEEVMPFVYGVRCYPKEIIRFVHDFLVTFVLYTPLIFALGMFPQISTFAMYVCEQMDVHAFGGNAVVSLKAGVYCLFRSVLAVLTLFGFAYAGLNESKSTQHVLFSIFISLLTLTAYHLSRSTSDPEPMWNLLKRHFWPPEHVNGNDDDNNNNNSNDSSYQIKRNNDGIVPTKNKSPKKKRSNRRRSNNNNNDENGATNGVIIVSAVPTDEDGKSDTLEDPLPAKLRKTIDIRLQSDIIVSLVVGVILFAIHRSMIFSALQPELNPIMWCTVIILGFILHYLIPQMRKQLPWMCIAKPMLVPIGMDQFEPREPSQVTNFEKVYIYFGFIERNIIYPVMFIGCMTADGPKLTEKFGPLLSSLLITLCGLKCLRLSFSNPSYQYIVVIFTVLLFQKQYLPSETFVIDYFVTAIMFMKIYDLILKIKFVMTYIAPWQITWGSAFHAFAQPFSLPHTGMLFSQVILSGLLSSPLYPFLGSAIFLTSYPRPVKFWERDYNTRRADHSNTKLSSHLERNLGADDNNLNSIFYEHLTRSLQHSLYGDLLLGRWGEISSGDCFVLASDYLNCMIHIVEYGNGFVTFQMRGLEFRGTYCQQREVEAITEGVGDDDGCCCCNPGHLPNMLALNVAFNQRWLAWEVIAARYVVEGFSISDNSASSILQVFDFRKMLIIYYVKSTIYYTFTSPKLESWLSNSSIMDALQPLKDKNFIDVDPVFNVNIDEDYDYRMSGISRGSFYNIYGPWIRFCNNNKEVPLADVGKDSDITTLCYALSLLGRRALGTASHNTAASVEFFLYGLHALFKGDFRIASARDEWVFSDMDLLHKVVAPAIRMALKLHQDHFMAPDEFESPPALYAAITSHRMNLIISHEGDPIWRKAVLSGMPSLLALRRVLDDGNDEYKVIMLNKRYLSFRLIKLNRECVRGLWAGQQQELVYLRNRNPERGSIQNAKQVLRNIINSSCDQPIGYPIFVSPLTTSYVETNEQIREYFGGPLNLRTMKNVALNVWKRIRNRCIAGCSSGSSVPSQDDGGFGNDGVYAMTTFNAHSGYNTASQLETSIASSGGTITRVSRASILPSSASKPGSTSLVSLAGFLSPAGTSPNTDTSKSVEKKTTTVDKDEEEEKETVLHRVRIVDPIQIHDGINQGRLIDVIWPDEIMRQRGGRNFWKDWVPEVGMEGQVVHKWVPNHPNPNKRSTFDRTILLVKIDDKYVPISESGVQDLGAEV